MKNDGRSIYIRNTIWLQNAQLKNHFGAALDCGMVTQTSK